MKVSTTVFLLAICLAGCVHQRQQGPVSASAEKDFVTDSLPIDQLEPADKRNCLEYEDSDADFLNCVRYEEEREPPVGPNFD